CKTHRTFSAPSSKVFKLHHPTPARRAQNIIFTTPPASTFAIWPRESLFAFTLVATCSFLTNNFYSEVIHNLFQDLQALSLQRLFNACQLLSDTHLSAPSSAKGHHHHLPRKLQD